MTDAGVLARLERIEQKLDRVLALLHRAEPELESVSGGLRDHEGQDAR